MSFCSSSSVDVVAWILICIAVFPVHCAVAGEDVEIDFVKLENEKINLNGNLTGNLIVKFPPLAMNESGNAVAILQPVCPLRKVLDCYERQLLRNYYLLLGKRKRLEIPIQHREREDLVVLENLEDGKYTLEISSSGKSVPFCVYRSQGSNVSEWNLALELTQGERGGILKFRMEESQEMKDRFNFKQFLVELSSRLDKSVVNHTILSYDNNNNNNRQLQFDFHNVRNGSYSAQVNPIDCRCEVPTENNEVPCKRDSNNESVVTLESTSGSTDESAVTQTRLLWYVVCSVFATAVVALAALLLKRMASFRKKRNRIVYNMETLNSTEELEEPLDLSSRKIQVLLLYDRADDRLKSKAAELGSILRTSLPHCVVHDYGDPEEEDRVRVEGVQWFASRVSRRMSRVIVITSAGLQTMEQAILDPERVCTAKMEMDPVSLAALNCVMNLSYVERGSYGRLFCVRFEGVDDKSDCKSLVPLQRFHLPQHQDFLLSQIAS